MNDQEHERWKTERPRGRTDFIMWGMALGIIAMLVGMLVPALRTAREKARRSSCNCNMKQIGLAMRLYSQDNKGWFPCDVKATTLGSFALLTNGYQTAFRSWICPSDIGVWCATTDQNTQGCNSVVCRAPSNTWTSSNLSYAYGGFGLSETTAPDTPVACDRTAGNLRGATPYVNNRWTHKSDGGNVCFADGHVAFQKGFIPPMDRGKNP